MQHLTENEEQKILCTVVHKMARMKMFYYLLFLAVVVFGILNFFNVLGDRSLVKDITLVILGIVSFIYGKRYKRACTRLYYREYDIERGTVVNSKIGTFKSNVCINNKITNKKYPILYILDEKQEQIEGKDCLLVKVFKDKKYIVLL
jgi:hypothetical protein